MENCEKSWKSQVISRWMIGGNPEWVFVCECFLYLLLIQYLEPDIWMDGWMTCDFTSFSTVLQSNQDAGRMIMKGCVQWNPVYD